MRVSVRKNDPGYHPMASQFGFKILLNGEDMTCRCHTADEEEGRLYCYDVNDNGHMYIDQLTQLPAEVTLYGKVEIIPLVNGARHLA